MLKLITRLARELNWARRAWSTGSDREFHEDLYRLDDYDPFSSAYPGNTTIRRFADLVEPLLPQVGVVVDLGCGPGEITCELASRRSDLTFLGIDHSAAAITKAHANVERLRLTNITFECRSVEEYVPSDPVHLITFFDSFHHILKPADLVGRLSPSVKRWALVEPRGSWAGTWRKDLDFDWVAQDVDKIRARIAASLGATGTNTTIGASPAPVSEARMSQAVERRYTLDDFRRFFAGYALDVRGTVAGLERYPPGSEHTGALRERFGQVRYELYRDLDNWLFERNLDFHAKHWLIVAERGGRSRQLSAVSGSRNRIGHDIDGTTDFRILGQFDVQYGAYQGPLTSGPDERIIGSIVLTNRGWETWSTDAMRIFVSYHWLDARERIVHLDGERTPLPRPIGAGETCEAAVVIRTPAQPGRYRLAIDLVREGVTWFSEAGHPWRAVDFTVRKS